MRVRLKLDRLIELVAQSSLSQNHRAVKIGISKGHWSAILSGRHPFPSPRTRERILEVFAVEFAHLFATEAGPAEGADASFQAAIADQYLIDREVGHGGMGLVYLARDVKHNRAVAIKVISAEAVSGVGVEQFLKEIRHATRLQHPHILPVYDSGHACGLPYFVTPYVASGSLRDLLSREGHLDPNETLQIVSGIAAALAHAHDRMVLHCDIKPANVLVTDGHASVSDFGIARVIHAENLEWGRQPQLDSSAGTPAYVSPEQASGELNLDPRSDVYSFACVVFEMLSGRPPFSGSTTMETVSRRFVEAVPDIRQYAPHVNTAVRDVLIRAMQLEPSKRFADAKSFTTALTTAAAQRQSLLSRRLGRMGTRALGVLRRIPWITSGKRLHLMDTMLQDLRFAVRSLLSRPGFTLVVALTLALGIGMNTAIFSVIYGVLYSPIPYPHAERLMRIGRTRPELPGVLLPISPANLVDLRSRIETFDGLAALAGRAFMVTGTRESQRVIGAYVTPEMLGLLGVQMSQGRPFADADKTPGAPRTVVLSHEFWRDELGAQPNVIGSTVWLDEQAHTVVGVTHEGFEILARNDRLWVPFQWDESAFASRQSNYLQIYGRLVPGARLAGGIAELDTEWRLLGEENADTFDDSGMAATGLLDAWVADSRAPLFLLAGAVGMVLLIACVNVANLILARAEARQRELAIRTALGAGRRRLVRQLLTEGIVLSVSGGVVGMAAALVGVQLLLAAFGTAVPRADEIGVQGVALAFGLLVSIGTGIVVGLIPALQARPDHLALQEGGRSSTRTTSVRQALVVAEIGLALMLVVGAGLFLRSFWEARQEELGFHREGLLVINTWLPPSRYGDAVQASVFYDHLSAELLEVAEIRDVGLTNMVPIRQFGSNYTRVTAVGDPDRFASFVEVRYVSPEYLRTLGVPLIQDRMLTDQDTLAARPLVVINQHLAGLLFDTRDPIGRQLDFGPQGSNQPEIVGVVGNVKAFGPDRDVRPIFYYATRNASNMVIRTIGDPLELVPAVRQVAARIDPEVIIYRAERMTDIIDRSLGDRQFQLTLLALFAVVALALGAVGVYGVMSYLVTQRTREFGVRMALGATTGAVLSLVLRQAGLLAAIGIGVGLAGAFALRRTIENLVFNVSPADPLTYAVVATLLAGVAVAACLVPARRAARVPPMEALRQE